MPKMMAMMTFGCIRSASYHMHSRCHERWTFMVNHCESHMPYRTFAIAGGGGGGAQAPACAGEGHACAAPVVLGPRAAEEAAASGGGHVFSSSFDLYACTIFISFTFLISLASFCVQIYGVRTCCWRDRQSRRCRRSGIR